MRTLTGVQGIGGAQELAEMLRQMGRGPDTMLAHITPDEAQMLLEAGGSGRINPMTGLPEFQPEDDYLAELRASEPPGYYGTSQTGFNQAIEAAEQIPFEQMTPRQQYDTPQVLGDNLVGGFEYTGGQDLQRFPTGFGPQFTPGGEFEGVTRLPMESPAEAMRLQEYAQGLRTPQEVQPTLLDRLKSGLQTAETGYRDFSQSYPMLSRLLTTGAASLPALLAARSARREGRAAAEELRAMSAPIRAEAEALRRQALTGGLTPQQARQQEARRAQLRQSAAGRGTTTGTQEAMIENTLARQRSELAEQNLNSALRQLNIANTIDEAAIRARLQSDRETDQFVANILGKLVRASAGVPTQDQGGQTQLSSSPLPNERLFNPPESRV